MVDTTKLRDIELDLTYSNQAEQDGPVECLGKTFASDGNRRQYYLTILAEKLKDPEFRKIEGFPIGEDEDILNLSDPPYYTACPNPWIEDFITDWEDKKPAQKADYRYHREPFAADVSEGRSGLFYDAHSYHTKVPHKAIMRYILHYTEPGDIVFDGFAGTGMAGVAAQMCGNREQVLSLGYQVKQDGTILAESIDEEGKSVWYPFSKLGCRRAILNDLSPIASFIAYNYNTPLDTISFKKEVEEVFDKVKKDIGWLYETLHVDNKTKGIVNYVIWSEIFLCPECGGDVVFWDQAVDLNIGKVRSDFNCPNCQASISKRQLQKSLTTHYDPYIRNNTIQVKRVPVLINYSLEGDNSRFEKKPTEQDTLLLEKISDIEIPYSIPSNRMMNGKESRRNEPVGITHVHHFYTKRNLLVLSYLQEYAKNSLYRNHLRFLINSYDLTHSTLMTRIIFKGSGKKPVLTGYQSGTLYVSSLPVEKNIFNGILKQKLPIIIRSIGHINDHNLVQTGDMGNIAVPENSIDYIFLDPPFGANLSYSELNFLWESWMRVFTSINNEAIENKSHGKGKNEYRTLMTACFSEAYRILKPGHWMTVEFSNTKASIWNSIQVALNESGFIIANVSALDKQQGSFKAVNTPTAVKQDLIISAYKPNGGFEDRFIEETNVEALWDFIRTHLGYLPVTKKQGNELVKIPERDPRILFDQVVAYFVRNLRDVPLSSKEFQDGLLERFAERDGMIFLPEQVAQYDKARITSSQLRQLDVFVDDEASSIEWLRQLLNDKPQTYQDIHPKFINELSGWKKAEIQLELSTLLEQNFIKFDGQGQVPPQIHSYLSTNYKDLRNLPKDDPTLLSKAKNRWYVPNPEREEDLQKLRERSLLKQFEEYKTHAGKKIRLIRMEAVRCGFKKAWQERDYDTIISVAEKIPQNLLQEDQKLLMWYDQAQTRSGDSF